MHVGTAGEMRGSALNAHLSKNKVQGSARGACGVGEHGAVR